MTRQFIRITNLKWPAFLVLLLIFAACATSAPPGNASSGPRESQPSPLPRQAAEVAEAPSSIGEPLTEADLTAPVNVPATVAFTPSSQNPPAKTISDPPNLAVQTLIAEATSVPVVSTTEPVPTVSTAIDPTSTTLATPPAVTPVPVAVVPPAAQQPTAASVPPSTLSLQQDKEAKLGKEQSAGEPTPVPTAAVSPPAAAVDTNEATGSARRFVLPSAQGNQVSLEEYLERGNVVLIFYRAFW